MLVKPVLFINKILENGRVFSSHSAIKQNMHFEWLISNSKESKGSFKLETHRQTNNADKKWQLYRLGVEVGGHSAKIFAVDENVFGTSCKMWQSFGEGLAGCTQMRRSVKRPKIGSFFKSLIVTLFEAFHTSAHKLFGYFGFHLINLSRTKWVSIWNDGHTCRERLCP